MTFRLDDLYLNPTPAPECLRLPTGSSIHRVAAKLEEIGASPERADAMAVGITHAYAGATVRVTTDKSYEWVIQQIRGLFSRAKDLERQADAAREEARHYSALAAYIERLPVDAPEAAETNANHEWAEEAAAGGGVAHAVSDF